MPANLENSAVTIGPEEVSFHFNPKESESEVAQLCSTLCNPVDCSLPGFSIMGFSRQEYWSGLPFPWLLARVKFYIARDNLKDDFHASCMSFLLVEQPVVVEELAFSSTEG